MKKVIVLAAIACFASSAVFAGSLPMNSVFQGAVENQASGAAKLPSDHSIRIGFNERVVMKGVTAIIPLDQAIILIDPVGSKQQYRRFGRPDIVVLTSADTSHLSIDTMIGMLRRDTVVLAPQAVIDQLPLMIANNVITPFEAGMTQVVDGITFRALSPSEKIPRGAEIYPRDRGDIGVIVEVNGASAYF